jgi:hypothetical protein
MWPGYQLINHASPLQGLFTPATQIRIFVTRVSLLVVVALLVTLLAG